MRIGACHGRVRSLRLVALDARTCCTLAQAPAPGLLHALGSRTAHARPRVHSRSILKYAGCSEETFILALIYMDQVVQFNPDFVISSLNVHRLLITSIMVRDPCAARSSLRPSTRCRIARHPLLAA